MSNIQIQDVDQRVQYLATTSQTVFAVPFPFLANSDLVVYQNGTLLDIGTGAGQYGVSGAGNPSGGTVTLVTGATLSDAITILGNQPIDRTSIYSATISNLTGSDLNNDFNREIIMLKQLWTVQNLLQLQYQPYALISQDEDVTVDRWLPILGANQAWVKNAGNSAIIAYTLPESGAAPKNGKYLLQEANAEAPNGQAMGDLASGIVVNTSGTGVQLTRTIQGTTKEIDVSNSSGIGGNPTIGLSDNAVIPGTAGMGIPQGTTAQRVIPSSGIGLRYNTDTSRIEFYSGGAWVTVEDDGIEYLPLAGGTMSGNINMGNNSISNISSASFTDGTFTVSFTPPVLTRNNNYILPPDFPSTTGYILSSTTAGVMSWIANTAGSLVSVVGTANQIDVDATDPQNPIVSLSPTVNLPGTFNIQSSTAIDAILDEDNMVSDSATAVPTQQSVKAYVDSSTTAIPNSDLATMADQTIKGNVSGGVAVPSDLTQTQILTFLGGTTGTGAMVREDSPNIITPTIVGVTDGSSAAAGDVGEIISVSVPSGSAVALTSGAAKTVAELPLTAGDWVIYGNVVFSPSGTTSVTTTNLGISTVTDTLPVTDLYTGWAGTATTPPALFGDACPNLKVSIAVPTSYFLVAFGAFTVSTLSAFGNIFAVRIR